MTINPRSKPVREFSTPPLRAFLSSRGQMVIPKVIRNSLQLGPGFEVRVALRSDGVIEIRPVRRTIAELFGHAEEAAGLPSTDLISDQDAIEIAVLESDRQTLPSKKSKK